MTVPGHLLPLVGQLPDRRGGLAPVQDRAGIRRHQLLVVTWETGGDHSAGKRSGAERRRFQGLIDSQ